MRRIVRQVAVVVLLGAGVAWGQPALVAPGPPTAPTCDQQVTTVYRGLVDDQVLAELRDATPALILSELSAQVRVRTKQYTYEQGDRQRYQGQVAILEVRVGQLTDTIKRLQQELDQAQRELAAAHPPASAEVKP